MALIQLPNDMWVDPTTIKAVIPREHLGDTNGRYKPASKFWVDILVEGIGKITIPCESAAQAKLQAETIAKSTRRQP